HWLTSKQKLSSADRLWGRESRLLLNPWNTTLRHLDPRFQIPYRFRYEKRLLRRRSLPRLKPTLRQLCNTCGTNRLIQTSSSVLKLARVGRVVAVDRRRLTNNPREARILPFRPSGRHSLQCSV